MTDRKIFDTQTVPSGQSRVYGKIGYATNDATTYNIMSNCDVHTVEITSVGLGVATISFNSGNGYGSAVTLSLSSPGTIRKSYYAPGIVALKVDITVAECLVFVESMEG